MMRKKNSIKAVVLLGVGGILLGAGYYFWSGSWRNITPPTEDGSFAKGYDLVLRTYEGNDQTLRAYRNTPLVLHSWASWCPFCAAELQNLDRMQSEFGDAVRIVAINRAEPSAEAQSFSDGLGLSGALTLLLDPSDALYKDIGGYAMPETVFINSAGEVAAHQRGPVSLEMLEQNIQAILQ